MEIKKGIKEINNLLKIRKDYLKAIRFSELEIYLQVEHENKSPLFDTKSDSIQSKSVEEAIDKAAADKAAADKAVITWDEVFKDADR